MNEINVYSVNVIECFSNVKCGFPYFQWLHLNLKHAWNIDSSLFIEFDFSIVQAKAGNDSVPSHKILCICEMGWHKNVGEKKFRYRSRSFRRNMYVMSWELRVRKSISDARGKYQFRESSLICLYFSDKLQNIFVIFNNFSYILRKCLEYSNDNAPIIYQYYFEFTHVLLSVFYSIHLLLFVGCP